MATLSLFEAMSLQIAVYQKQIAPAKLLSCLRLARNCSRESRNHLNSARDRSEFRRLKRESMEDARYWKTILLQ